MGSITIDMSGIETTRELHSRLAKELKFPDYYGMNWDAFWDCISVPEQSSMPDKLVIRGISLLERDLPQDAQLLRECLNEYRQEIPHFEVVYES